MDTLTARPTAPAEPDCIGPIAIAPRLAHELEVLAAGAAADDLAPFVVCASELLLRWSRGGTPRCARVIRGRHEAFAHPVAPTGTTPDRAHLSFRDALVHLAARPAEEVDPADLADVTILISSDGERMYLERTTTGAGGPCLGSWADTYLGLLGTLAERPDAPQITRPGTPGDGVTVLAAS